MPILTVTPVIHETDQRWLLLELAVDGEPLADFSLLATDRAELARAAGEAGGFFILTCWCGVPECVGIERPVQVEHLASGQTRWRVRDPAPAREWLFDSSQYRQAIAEGLELYALWLQDEAGQLEPVP